MTPIGSSMGPAPPPPAIRGEHPSRPGPYLGSRFHIEDAIGAGPSGSVYRGLDLERGLPVAIKILHPKETQGPRFAVQFRGLCLALAQLEHENLVHLHDYGLLDGRYFLVSDLVDGLDVTTYLARRRALDPGVTVRIGLHTCLALGTVHAHGLVHQALKPNNVLLTRGGQVKVSDPGLSALISTPAAAQNRPRLPEAHYLSPEQARGEAVGPTSDLYSLGALLFEMLTGRPPFEAGDFWELMRLVGHAPPPSPRTYRAEVPPALSDLVLHALGKDPSERFSSADEMADALREILRGSLNRSWLPAASLGPAEPSRRRMAAVSTESGLLAHRGLPPRGRALATGAQFVTSFGLTGIALLFLAGAFVGPGSNLAPLSRPQAETGPSEFPARDRTLWDRDGTKSHLPPTSDAIAMVDPGWRPVDASQVAPPPVAASTNDASGETGLPPTATPPAAVPTDNPSQQGSDLVIPGQQDNTALDQPDGGAPPGGDGDSASEGSSASPDDDVEDHRWAWEGGEDWDHEDEEEREAGRERESEDEDRETEFWGIVESQNGPLWVISGRGVVITSTTEIEGRIALGALVSVEVIQVEGGPWVALEINQEDADEHDS